MTMLRGLNVALGGSRLTFIHLCSDKPPPQAPTQPAWKTPSHICSASALNLGSHPSLCKQASPLGLASRRHAGRPQVMLVLVTLYLNPAALSLLLSTASHRE